MNSKRLFAIVSLVLAALMMLSFTACKNGEENVSTPDESTVAATTASVETTVAPSSTAAPTSTAATTAPASSTAAKDTQAEGGSDNGGSYDAPVAVNPEGEEIIGAGSSSQPYLETPSSDMTVTTVKVPAGKALYYDIYRVGGKYLEIYDADAYVIYDGDRYDAYDGVVSFVVGPALASDTVSFQIGNAGSTAKSFELCFYDLYGSYENPEIINKMDGTTIYTELYVGDDNGYNYKYTAEKNGTIRFYVKNSLDDFLFSATRNKYSDGELIPVQSTFVDGVQSDSTGNYIEVEVLKDETVVIGVSSYPMGAYYPAVTVEWYGIYSK